jgi:hypothetical protein
MGSSPIGGLGGGKNPQPGRPSPPPPVPAVEPTPDPPAPKGFPRGKTPREIRDEEVRDYQRKHGTL